MQLLTSNADSEAAVDCRIMLFEMGDDEGEGTDACEGEGLLSQMLL